MKSPDKTSRNIDRVLTVKGFPGWVIEAAKFERRSYDGKQADLAGRRISKKTLERWVAGFRENATRLLKVEPYLTAVNNRNPRTGARWSFDDAVDLLRAVADLL